MQLSHVTLRDPDLAHQVVIYSIDHVVNISCNCRATGRSGREIHYDSMGESRDLNHSRELYNDPTNHTIPFTEEDKAKW